METPLSRADLLLNIRKLRFEQANAGWQEKRLTHNVAGHAFSQSQFTFPLE